MLLVMRHHVDVTDDRQIIYRKVWGKRMWEGDTTAWGYLNKKRGRL